MDTTFAKNLLQGKLGQGIIENIFLKFGYEVYPYGYKSYFTNIIKGLRINDSSRVVRQLRSTPDIVVYDRNKPISKKKEKLCSSV